jgi:ElaB/YqjD/DUF883 family membrane-anchored ribosome-binding protein
MDPNQMTNTERSAYLSSPNTYGSSGTAPDVTTDDLAAKGAAAFRETKTGVESVFADAREKGQQAMNNVRQVRDTFAGAIEKSITTRPYTTLALAVVTGLLFGATWRR